MHYYNTLKKLLKKYKNYIWNYKFYTIFFVALIMILISSSEPFFTSKAVSFVEKFIQTNEVNTDSLILFFSLWIAYIIINSFVKYFYSYYLIEKNTIDFYINESKNIKEKVIYMSEKSYVNKKSWKIYKIIDRWLEWVFSSVFLLFLEILPSIISIIFVTIVLFSVNIKMAIATLSVTPILVYVWYFFTSKTKDLQTEVNKKWDLFYTKIWDYLTNLTQVKTLTFENNASNELNKIQIESKKLQLPLSKRWTISWIYVTFLINLTIFLVLWTWILLIKSWEITFAILFLYFAYINFIFYPLSFIFNNLRNLQKHLEGIKNMNDEFENIEQDLDYEFSKDINKIKWKIEFKNVFFSYSEEKEILKNINFTINPWEKIALVWDTWWWKTTITNLILRLYEIEKWEISIDDISIKNFTKKSLRKHIWIVMQDNTLFNTSIENNLRFAKNNATKKEIEDALKKARAEFVFETKDSIKSEIWERWLKLSWWEKQRISIARTFLKDPEILILDEATSALDNKTEKEIQKSLNDLMKWKTTIIIAHRLSTIKKVDRIYVIENWKIVESGNYEELINANGKFYNLANPDNLIMNFN